MRPTCPMPLPARAHVCPTNAIVEPGVIDARRCLAWLVQAEGSFPREFRVALGNRIYGCDVCLEVCPWNRFARDGRRMLLASRHDLAELTRTISGLCTPAVGRASDLAPPLFVPFRRQVEQAHRDAMTMPRQLTRPLADAVAATLALRARADSAPMEPELGYPWLAGFLARGRSFVIASSTGYDAAPRYAASSRAGSAASCVAGPLSTTSPWTRTIA